MSTPSSPQPSPAPRIAAGWYPDPEHPRSSLPQAASRIPQRYWDGAAWTDQRRLPDPTPRADLNPDGTTKARYSSTAGYLYLVAGVAAVLLIFGIIPLALR